MSANPGLEAKTLFAALQRQYPDRFVDGQLRTLQRRIKRWRAIGGPAQEVYFVQEHRAGELCESDSVTLRAGPTTTTAISRIRRTHSGMVFRSHMTPQVKLHRLSMRLETPLSSPTMPVPLSASPTLWAPRQASLLTHLAGWFKPRIRMERRPSTNSMLQAGFSSSQIREVAKRHTPTTRMTTC